MDDYSLMPFGKFKGEKLANVPAYYLIYLYKNNKCHGDLREYIDDNYTILISEIESEKAKVED